MIPAVNRDSVFEDACRRSFESGCFDMLARWHSDDICLESWVDGACQQARGTPEAIRHLELMCPGPASVSLWRMTASSGGYELYVQRNGGVDSCDAIGQHHIFHVNDESRVYLHIVYPSKSRGVHSQRLQSLRKILSGVRLADVLMDGTSGASVYRVHLCDGSTVIVKYESQGTDWLMRATRDPGRQGLLWRLGFFEALPQHVGAAITAVHELDDGWAIVMRDVEPALRVFALGPTAFVPHILKAAMAIHASPPPSDVSILCTCADRLRIFSPIRPYIEWRERDMIPKTLTRMWQTFADLSARGVVDAVFDCVEDPRRLLDRIARFPQGVLHGDLRFPNIGWDGKAIILLDWALACFGPLELEIVAFVCDATFWSDVEPGELMAEWASVSGGRVDSEALDVAFIYQAAMGELAFLSHELLQRPQGVTRLSADRLAWWLRRVEAAFDRVSL